MRPSPWMTGLLACTIRSVGAQRGPDPVAFAVLETFQAGTRILVPGKEDQKLTWKVQDGVTVSKVEIWNGYQAIGRWPQDKVETSTGMTHRGLQSKDEALRDTTVIALNVTHEGLVGNLLFNIPAIRNVQFPQSESQTWANNFEKPLHAKLSWTDGSVAGPADDQPFVIANNDTQIAIDAAQLVLDAAAPTGGVSTTTTFANGGFSTPTGSASNPSTASGVTNSPVAASPDPAPLNDGAIAGIAVGAVALLVIVGVLVWFFCFRRRKQHSQTHQAGYGQDAGTHAMMVDKEVPGVSESSPHSAYGDDGGRLHDRSTTAMDSSYAPYRDHTPAMTPAPVAHASPATTNAMPSSQTHLPQHATSAQTPPATTQYAHLVEEGMTPDEIRRLEEEERALDQDIEASRANH